MSAKREEGDAPVDVPAEFLPARQSIRLHDFSSEEDLAEFSRQALERARNKPLPPIPVATLAVTSGEVVEEEAVPADDDGEIFFDDQGRRILAKSMRHNGRVASVMVELDAEGKPKQIISGTARQPGESESQYLRKMSSYAGWQLRNTQAKRGISWTGDQKYPYFCYLVILITFFILLGEIAENGWVLEAFEVNPVLGPSKEVLLRMGAKLTSLIVNEGQFHRLFTAFWLHGGIIHWLVNMIALINLGFSLERDFGTPKITLLFLSCGFMGVLTSAVFMPQVMGVGASGAIFGLFGCAWADLIQNWGIYVSRKRAKSALCQLTFGTIINLLLGLAPMLDQFAHLGGLFTGLFLGFGITMEKRYTRFNEEKPWRTYQRVLRVFGLVIVPASLVIMLALLHVVEQDVRGWCPVCNAINCLPIAGLWTCDMSGCSDDPTVRGTAFLNNTLLITCPGGRRQVWTEIDEEPTSQLLLAYCQELC